MNLPERHDGWDLALLLYALAGTSLSLAGAISTAFVAAIAYLSSDIEAARTAQWTATGLLCLAATGVPALWLSARIVIKGERPSSSIPSEGWLRVGGLFPLGLLLGFLAYEREILSPILGPIGQILAIASPAAIAVLLVRRAGPQVSLRRIWSHILIGLWAVPAAALVLEGIVFLMGVVTTSAALTFAPGGQELLADLQQLLSSIESDPSFALIADIALHPVSIFLLVAFLGFFVPLIEELAKTASIWPVLSRRLSGREAFLGGALGGTGFALAEALFLAQPGSGWLITAIARAGATMIHALAAGLASWSLAEVVKRRRWHRGLIGVALAVILHGLWNISAIGIGLSQVASVASADVPPVLLTRVSSAAIGTIVVLGTGAVWLLPRLQRRADGSEATPATENFASGSDD